MTPKDREEMVDRLGLLFDAGVDWAMDDEGYPHGGQLPARSKAAAVEALIPFIEQLVVEARNEGIREAVAAVRGVKTTTLAGTALVNITANAVSGLLPKEDQP